MYQPGDALSVNANVTIFREGDHADCAYIIEEGCVEVSLIRHGRKVVVGQRAAGEVFGEMAIIDRQPRTATVSTLTPCKFIKIDRGQIRSRLAQSDPIVRMYLEVILSRFRQTMGELQDLSRGVVPAETAGLSHAAASTHASNDYEYAINEIRLEDEISRGLRRNEFELYFQPIVDLQHHSLVGFEALIRWQHRHRGLISPNHFLSTAEASGLIVPIGGWVFWRSCEFLRAVKYKHPSDQTSHLFISVNISSKELVSPGFVDTICGMVDRSEIAASDVKLEITETALLGDQTVAAGVLRRLKDFGFSIAIDDFGTGYSSLSYLHQFPFDTLKIDKSFVQSLNLEPKNNAIVASIVSLAEHLNLSVVAEGIETPQQETLIRDLKCAFGQGYLYAMPMKEVHAFNFARRWLANGQEGLGALA